MDASHQLIQLANDSFSYAWLIDVKSSSSAGAAVVGDSQRSHDDAAGSFIEIDPDGFFSMRWSSTSNDDGFDFSLPPPQCSEQVHADQIFSGGHLLPLLDRQQPFAGAVTPSARRRLTKSQSVNSNRFDSPRRLCAGSSTPAPAKSSSSPKKMARKYFCFLTPLYKMVKDIRLVASSSSSSFSSSSSSSFKSASTGKDSARSSPRSSDAMSSADWCRGSSNADISINDAILHCKQSIGRGM